MMYLKRKREIIDVKKDLKNKIDEIMIIKRRID